jgi:hypothetical protein
LPNASAVQTQRNFFAKEFIMYRLAIPFIVLCFPLLTVEGQEPNQQSHLPIYRGAMPFMSERQEPTTTIINGKTYTNHPKPSPPWKPEDLKNFKTFLPLGEGESIDDNVYRFTVTWQPPVTDTPLLIRDLSIQDNSDFLGVRGNFRDALDRVHGAIIPTLELRYRPIELVKGNVVRFKFEFVPIRFLSVLTEPKQEFLDLITINTAQMKILVNGKKEGFTVHFSRDGKQWYGLKQSDPVEMGKLIGSEKPFQLPYEQMPYDLLPHEVLFLRIATKDSNPIESFMFDFQTILETPGFCGKGETFVGLVTGRKSGVHCTSAFFDDENNINFLIDNTGSEALKIGGISASYHSDGFSMAHGDGYFTGPTILANSSGIYRFMTNKEPGEHRYILTGDIGFNFAYQLTEAEKRWHVPHFSRAGYAEGIVLPPRSKEYKPEDGQLAITFED